MIHLFEKADMKLVLDAGSGAVHILDAVAYDLLGAMTKDQLLSADEELKRGNSSSKSLSEILMAANGVLNKYSTDALAGSVSEIAGLIGAGALYADDSYAEFQDALGLAPVKAMCLHVAHDCNLRCRYCFASTGGFGGSRKLMPFETAQKAIDLLVRLSEGRRNLEVDFFGGEPLMNMAVVRQTVEYARRIEEASGKNFRFTITTNGLALNEENINFINENMSNAVLSVDGRREINDAMRPAADGGGSYDLIMPRFRRLVAGRGNKEYYVRGTYTRNNLDFDADVLELFKAGFRQISVEPVVARPQEDYSIREADIPAIEESYLRLMEEIIERKNSRVGEFNFFHFMLDLENGPCAIKRLKGCGSGNEYLAVTPEGELYPCHQFVGDKNFAMGTVESGITRTDLKVRFANANVFNKERCRSCWAKFFCSGGCNANNHYLSGSVLSAHDISCRLEKFRLECAIAIKAATLTLADEY